MCCHNTALLITMYFYRLFLQKCNYSQAQCKLPEDGPYGPKHVAANIRYFNVNSNILYEGWNFNSGNYLFTTDTK